MQPVLPSHPAYHEVGKLDPQGRADIWSEPRPGVPVQLGEHVVRTTGADGDNSYRVGSDAQGWEDVGPGAIRLVEADRIVIAPDLASVPPQWLAAADWLAPARGFLQPLR